MTLVVASNSTSPNQVRWATVDTDTYDRATQLAGLAENHDLHDHSAGKCLPVARGAFTNATPVTVQSATALTVARSGTDYALQVDTNTTSSATGIKITAAAAAGGVAIAAISSGTNENLTLDAKGSGTITLGGTSTGAITLTRATTASAGVTVTTGGLTVSAGGVTVTGNSTITGTLGGLTGLTVASGGLTVTAGGLTVTAGGVVVSAGGLAVDSGAVSGSDRIAVDLNQNAATQIKVTNANTGASSLAAIQLVSVNSLYMGVASANYGSPYTSKSFIQSNSSAGLMIQNTHASGPIQFYVNSSTLAWTITSSGNLSYGGNYSTSGNINFPNAGAIYGRNAGNSADIHMLSVNASDEVVIGHTSSSDTKIQCTTNCYPSGNGGQNLGKSSNRWNVVYAISTDLSSHSDYKRNIRRLAPRLLLDLARETVAGGIHAFRFKSAPENVHISFLAERTRRLLSLDGRSASPQSTASVALGAVVGLEEKLEARMAGLDARLAALEAA